MVARGTIAEYDRRSPRHNSRLWKSTWDKWAHRYNSPLSGNPHTHACPARVPASRTFPSGWSSEFLQACRYGTYNKGEFSDVRFVPKELGVNRSPWTGLTGAQGVVLSEYLGKPFQLGRPTGQAAWDAHLEFARRTAVLLVANDLHGAIDAAEVAAAALRIAESQSARESISKTNTIIDQQPTASIT